MTVSEFWQRVPKLEPGYKLEPLYGCPIGIATQLCEMKNCRDCRNNLTGESK